MLVGVCNQTKKAGEAGYRSQGRERATELYQLGHQQVTQLRLVEEVRVERLRSLDH